MRIRASLLVLLVAAIVVTTLGGVASVGAQQERFFPDTGYSVADDAFWDYFQKRGGVNTFGQPVSRKFLFMGAEVQFFQRLVMQKRPDGSVTTLNLLDAGLMPVTHVNGSIFPSIEQALIDSAPTPAQPEYGARIIQFVRDNAPDTWNDLNVNFYQTFNGVVSFEAAFPDGNGDPGLLPLLNLEIWGAPTSRPQLDANNHEFVYQRFQRVIAHYDRGCDCTRALLLADWFKSVLTGRNLPPDLAAEMAGSPHYLQYDLTRPNGVARPELLPGTNMLFAFEREDRPIPNAPTPQPTVPTSTTPGPTASPTVQANSADVAVLSSDLAQDPVSKHWIGYGEVQNNASVTVEAAVLISVADVADRPLAVKQEEVSVSPLAPGQVSPFRIDFGRLPNGVDHFVTETRAITAQAQGVNGLRIGQQRSADDGKRLFVTGIVENRSGDDVHNVKLAVSFFNDDDELLDVWQGYPVFDSIDDGERVAFQAHTELTDPDDIAEFSAYVVGFRGAPSPEREDDVATLENTRVEIDDDDILHVFGEVEATTEDDAVDVVVAAVFFDADNNVVGSGSGSPLPVRVRPESTAPIEIVMVAPPEGYDHVEYTVLGQRFGDRNGWPQPLKINDDELDASSSGATLSGNVENDTDNDVHDVFIVVAFYNSADRIVDVVAVDLEDADLGEDDEEEFEVSTTASGVDSASVRAYGYRE